MNLQESLSWKYRSSCLGIPPLNSSTQGSVPSAKKKKKKVQVFVQMNKKKKLWLYHCDTTLALISEKVHVFNEEEEEEEVVRKFKSY